jgi:hypothetical protein
MLRYQYHPMWATCPMHQGHTTASTAKVKIKKMGREKICWLHLRVHSLSRDGPEGHHRYPLDWVHSRTGFKARQGVAHASTRCHVPYGSRPRHPTKVGSDAATCPVALNLITLRRWTLALPHVQWLRTSPHHRGGL